MWNASEKADLIIPAFVKALSAMDDVGRNKKVDAGPMKYKYADLSAVLDAVRPALRENGLGLSQYPSADGVTTIVFHESGQWLEFPPLMIQPTGNGPQQVGSAISYARRYAILSVLGLATEDDDGVRASRPEPVRPDPTKERIDALVDAVKALPEEEVTALREWTRSEGKLLSPKALAADLDWLGQAEAYVQAITESLADDGLPASPEFDVDYEDDE